MLSSCSDIPSRYEELDKRFYILTDDEINEKDREKLQKDYEKFIKNMDGDLNDADLDTILMIKEYKKKSKIKLQFLKDLK